MSSEMARSGILRHCGSLRRAVLKLSEPASRRRASMFGAPVFRVIRIAVARLVHASGARALLNWSGKIVRRTGRAVYARLFRSRRRLKPYSIRLAELVWHASQSRIAGRIVNALLRLQSLRPRIIARLYLKFVWTTHVFALTSFLAAGQTERAVLFARLLNLMFRHHIRDWQRPSCNLYFEAMYRASRFSAITHQTATPKQVADHHLNHVIGTAHLYSRNVELAKYYLGRAIEVFDGSYIDHRMLGRCHLLAGEMDLAEKAFARSVALMPQTVMAHQNYAGRYEIETYQPITWELKDAGRLLVYDNLGQLAEEFFLRGQFELSFRLYQRMLDCQTRLATRQKALPAALQRRLQKAFPGFDPARPTRILPYEWVTQFGHIGLLDSYSKMARLGKYPDSNVVLLAPKAKVVNAEYLAYWDSLFFIVRDDALVDELFPYQRQFGDGFMAYPGTDGRAEPWTLEAAKAQAEWSRQRRAPLIAIDDDLRAEGLATLEKLGVPAGSWFVGLHVREGGYYGESTGGISTHRNAAIEDYTPAVRAITERGGYVIRLGDRSMTPFAERNPRVIDYALSPLKSPRMDIFLCAACRFVIGTTSGLTTACLSFGTPMVLVNAISNDWQLWTGDTDFIFKRIRDRRNKRFLTLREAFSQPIQGYLINNAVMARHGLFAMPNTPEEILDAVEWKLARVFGEALHPDAEALLAAYDRAMAHNPMMFGAARPVPAFIARHSDLLDEPATGAGKRTEPVAERVVASR